MKLLKTFYATIFCIIEQFKWLEKHTLRSDRVCSSRHEVNLLGILQFYDLNREIDSFAGFYKIKNKPWNTEEFIRFCWSEFEWWIRQVPVNFKQCSCLEIRISFVVISNQPEKRKISQPTIIHKHEFLKLNQNRDQKLYQFNFTNFRRNEVIYNHKEIRTK